ncbi:hypothetical protein [Halobacillus andaensis]|uniref:hypothetical protein n=1 Tax=Halobacillus andaensis TaxID=1176239 RepID=UPI003D72FB46
MKDSKSFRMILGFITGTMIAVGYHLGMAATSHFMLSIFIALTVGVVTRLIGHVLVSPSH